MITQASIEKRLRKIEEAMKTKTAAPMLPEFFYVWTHIEDVEQFERDCHAKCKAMKPERYPAFVHFVGPEGGLEYGTGPFQEDEDPQ